MRKRKRTLPCAFLLVLRIVRSALCRHVHLRILRTQLRTLRSAPLSTLRICAFLLVLRISECATLMDCA